MRALFIIMVFCVSGCGAPYFDLTQPIYMVTDDSFWTGCPTDDPVAYKDCQTFRVAQVEEGINQWFSHFAEATRPRVIIYRHLKDIPSDRFNVTIVHLRVSDSICEEIQNHTVGACYLYGFFVEKAIVFVRPEYISVFLAAHEFGHVLNRSDDHNDMPPGIYSVMSYTLPSFLLGAAFYVLPIDIDLVCEIHSECPVRDSSGWCEGGFYDPCLCPSVSVEDGVTKRNAGVDVCTLDSGEDQNYAISGLIFLD